MIFQTLHISRKDEQLSTSSVGKRIASTTITVITITPSKNLTDSITAVIMSMAVKD
jgi:hypothetical protein